MDLDKHVAIVTGGGRGIGRATALELARMGATIVVAEFDAANGQRTADEVAKLRRPSLAIATDVTRRADLDALVRRTQERFGRIDVLVNNAGIYRAAATLDVIGFLASPKSAYMTGQALSVDGGLVMH